LAGGGGAALAAAMRRMANPKSEFPASLIKAEQIRASMLEDAKPLVDGTLGPGGAYETKLSVAAACKASKPALQAYLLYALAAEFRPEMAIELGTNLGLSSAYLAAGLAATPAARLVTFDASPYKLRVARDIHSRLGFANIGYRQGLFADVLAPALRELPPVEMAFIDGHHDYAATLAYAETIFAHAAPAGVLIFDDIRWSAGMQAAWAELSADPRFRVVADLERIGICVIGEGKGRKPVKVTFPLSAWKRRRLGLTNAVKSGDKLAA
jgi:predicted O-methyltransferase YrrM